jgi:hypothetical protein
MSMFKNSTIPDIFVAQALTALFAALGFWLRERSSRRNTDSQYRASLTQVREQVQAIDIWLKAYRQVAPTEAREQASVRAKYDLERAYAKLTQAQASLEEKKYTADVSPHWLMSVTAIFLFCLPLGLVGLAFSIRTSDMLRKGDLVGATRNSVRAKISFWVTFGVGMAFWVGYLVIAAATPPA